MNHEKVINISDTLHGTILISTLENKIISTTAFNRLHNILQNSTVYLTYPSNQTKRFEHSLGVMTLGGKIFYHSISNADKETRNAFLDEINKQVGHLIENQRFIEQLETKFGESYIRDIIRNWKNINLNEAFYKFHTPKLIEDQHIFAYLLTHQSVRLAALLHDIGHPPFSHITEYALKKLWTIVNSKDVHTEREKIFLNSTKFYSVSRSAKLHEQIGDSITNRLTKSVLNSMKPPSNDEEAKVQLFYAIVHHFVNYIFEEKIKIFEDIHRIIASSIDCDRLDYVTRDMQNSGLNYGSIEYERIISSMKLMRNENDFLFCPNIKALSSIEDFFNRRWILYQNIIYHHRVVKTDSLLGNAIVNLGKDYLEKSDTCSTTKSTEESDVLPLDISGLWSAVKEAVFNEGYFNGLIQWDDAWLLTVLRKEFFTSYAKIDETSRYQLEELLSNKKYYRSMIKKLDAFQKLDKIVAENFVVDFSELLDKSNKLVAPHVIQLRQRIEKTKGFMDPLLESLESMLDEISNGAQDESHLEKLDSINQKYKEIKSNISPLLNKESNEESGFFLWALQKAYLKLFDANTTVFEEKVEEIICEIAKNKYNVKDCMVVFKNPKTGLEENYPYLYFENELINLNDASKIDFELNTKRSFFPLFFIYVHEERNSEIKHSDFLNDMGIGLGKGLAKVFEEEIDRQQQETNRKILQRN